MRASKVDLFSTWLINRIIESVKLLWSSLVTPLISGESSGNCSCSIYGCSTRVTLQQLNISLIKIYDESIIQKILSLLTRVFQWLEGYLPWLVHDCIYNWDFGDHKWYFRNISIRQHLLDNEYSQYQPNCPKVHRYASADHELGQDFVQG